MDLVNRKVTYRLYPSSRQANQMTEMLRLHQRLYNCALEQRIDAYQRCAVSLSFSKQCADLTRLRGEMPEYADLNAQSSQVTLKRLDLAFQAFFRRVKGGAGPAGFPRFKVFDRYPGWGYKAHGDGWKFSPNTDFINGTLRLSGVGNLQARGRARFVDEAKTSRDPGVPKTMEIIRKGDKWFASVTFETPIPFRKGGDVAVGLDWGTTKFMTMVTEHGGVIEVENPRLMKAALGGLRSAQRKLSRKQKGSVNRLKAKRVLARRHEKVAAKREDFLHQESARIVGMARLVATEDLNIKNMTVAGGAHKAGLNRSILDTSPAEFFSLLRYKAEDAGIKYVEVPTRKLKPSQTCSGCGRVEKKPLSQRLHSCSACSLELGRDVNAARVMLNFALYASATGQELALGVEEGRCPPMKHETPPIPERSRKRA